MHAVKIALERRATHDEIYDRKYFQRVADEKQVSMAHIADAIVNDLSPTTVMDVGCGAGFLLLAFRQRGVTCSGIEYADAAIEDCRRSGLDVQKFDLERDRWSGLRVDVATSLEVAEHLPASAADRFVQLLVDSAPTVVFTAAPPGQGGVDHVNEQPRDYWSEKFEGHGFAMNKVLTRKWQREWQSESVIDCYWQNLMVFQHKTD